MLRTVFMGMLCVLFVTTTARATIEEWAGGPPRRGGGAIVSGKRSRVATGRTFRPGALCE